ncbi:MAG: hypothetical protein CL672_08525 [Balneola sp.]|nr:hypothetical protein [Balneola sp.]|tara:strand:+ start:4250 stop:5584 length:1335 start_codon:yes stop_codon:yes gene_type:complete
MLNYITATLLVFTSLLLFSCDKQNDNYPNIVLIVGDDQGYPYFGFMGSDYVYTPNMDELAKNGTLFTQGYVPQNHCRPSLQTLMTGMLPSDYEVKVKELIKTKSITPLNEKDFRHNAMQHFETLPKILRQYGYISFQSGKWWEYNFSNGGFDKGMTTGWTKEDEAENGWFKKFMGGEGLKIARSTMKPVFEFISENKVNPFFIWYAPELPHYPFNAPKKYYDMYKDTDFTKSAKRYYANCSWFDDSVGELIQFLKDSNEFENTLFVYVNDNGWEQEPYQEFRNDSLRWHNGGDKGKLSVYDQSFRTPIIFSWKDNINASSQSNSLIHSADIPATMLDLIGVEVPNNFFGKSYRNVIQNTGISNRDIIIGMATQIRSENDMMGEKTEAYWARTNDWFFKWNLSRKTIELFDMNTDSKNETNIAEIHPKLVADFIEKIETWKMERK